MITMEQRVKAAKVKLVIIGLILLYLVIHHFLTGAPVFAKAAQPEALVKLYDSGSNSTTVTVQFIGADSAIVTTYYWKAANITNNDFHYTGRLLLTSVSVGHYSNTFEAVDTIPVPLIDVQKVDVQLVRNLRTVSIPLRRKPRRHRRE